MELIRYVVFFTLILLINCHSESDQSQIQHLTHNEQCSQPDSIYVTQVFDGDTFVLSNGQKVRIVMIDTPETGQPLYDQATTCLSELILNRAIKLKPCGSGTDRYERILAEVMLDTVNIGRRMLYNGLAVLYAYPDNKHMIDNYLPAQTSAIERHVGLWGLPAPVTEDFYINISGSYRFHRPLCSHLKNSDPAKFICYESREEALKNGLSPCRSCKP